MVPKLTSYMPISVYKVCMVDRASATRRLTEVLHDTGVCVIHGFGGVGKSTLAAQYAHAQKSRQVVRWLPADSSSKLRTGYEQIADELKLDHRA